MVDLELIKKILFEDGEDGSNSIDLEHLKLAKKVLTNVGDVDLLRKVFYCKDLGVQTDKAMLVDFINYYGAENIYVGERANCYSNGQLEVRDMCGRTLISGSLSKRTKLDIGGKKSLFKHDEHDYYYYDLLDQNRRCEHVSPDAFYIRNGCANMVNIMSILEKQETKIKK